MCITYYAHALLKVYFDELLNISHKDKHQLNLIIAFQIMGASFIVKVIQGIRDYKIDQYFMNKLRYA